MAALQSSGLRTGSALSASRVSLRGAALRAPTSALPRHARHRAVRVAAGLVQKLTAEELEVAIAERDRPLIVDFYATWCGPCVMLAKTLEELQAELGESVRIVKVDTDEEQDLSSQLQIQGLPTLVFIPTARDKPALRTEGLLPAETIKRILAEEMK